MSISTSEKISRLESLLSRVSARVSEPRVKAALAPALASAEAPPAHEPSMPPVLAPPPVSAPAPVVAPTPPATAAAEPALTGAGRHSERPMAPQLEVLPDLDFSDESSAPDLHTTSEPDEELEQPTVASPAASALSSREDAGALEAEGSSGEFEFAPPHTMVPRATQSAPALSPIDMPESDDGSLEIDHSPLAAAVNSVRPAHDANVRDVVMPASPRVPEELSALVQRAQPQPASRSSQTRLAAVSPPAAETPELPQIFEAAPVSVAKPVAVVAAAPVGPSPFRALLLASLELRLRD